MTPVSQITTSMVEVRDYDHQDLLRGTCNIHVHWAVHIGPAYVSFDAIHSVFSFY